MNHRTDGLTKRISKASNRRARVRGPSAIQNDWASSQPNRGCPRFVQAHELVVLPASPCSRCLRVRQRRARCRRRRIASAARAAAAGSRGAERRCRRGGRRAPPPRLARERRQACRRRRSRRGLDDAPAFFEVGVAPRADAAASPPAAPRSSPPGWGGDGGEDIVDPDGSARRALEVAIDRTGLFRAIEERPHGCARRSRWPPTSRASRRTSRASSSAAAPSPSPSTCRRFSPTPSSATTCPAIGHGVGGDFVTSLEVSAKFGELCRVLLGDDDRRTGKPANVRLVELGPGRGTLMADLLRGTAVFEDFTDAVSADWSRYLPNSEGSSCSERNSDLSRSAASRGNRGRTRTPDAEAAYDVGDGARVLADIRIPKNPHSRARRGTRARTTPRSDSEGARSSVASASVDRGVSRRRTWSTAECARDHRRGPPGTDHPHRARILRRHARASVRSARNARLVRQRPVALRGDAGASAAENGADASDASDASSSPGLELVLSTPSPPAGALPRVLVAWNACRSRKEGRPSTGDQSGPRRRLGTGRRSSRGARRRRAGDRLRRGGTNRGLAAGDKRITSSWTCFAIRGRRICLSTWISARCER